MSDKIKLDGVEVPVTAVLIELGKLGDVEFVPASETRVFPVTGFPFLHVFAHAGRKYVQLCGAESNDVLGQHSPGFIKALGIALVNAGAWVEDNS